jgi:hypothetical protein
MIKPLPLFSPVARYKYALTCNIGGVPHEFRISTELPGEDLAESKFTRWLKWHRSAGVPLGRVTKIEIEYDREAAA